MDTAEAPLRAPAPLGAPPLPRPQPGWLKAAGQVWGILRLAGGTARALATPPFTWRREFVDQAWLLTARAALPLLLSAFAFAYGAPGIQAAVTGELLGSVERFMGTNASAGSIREIAVWVTAMVVAGVAGTAICADLGARKVRDELEALEVMGIDPVHRLVAPRVLALAVVMPALGVVAIVASFLGMFVALLQVGGSFPGYWDAFIHNLYFADILAFLVKTTLVGAVVALVCCYKGMNASGGPLGVGRAVNQAVVTAFVVIWIINFAANSIYQALSAPGLR